VLDVAGPAGAGKTRLLVELGRRARRRGFAVLSGRAAEYAQHIPFEPFADAFADLDARAYQAIPDLLEAAGPVVRAVEPRRVPASDTAGRFHLYRATARLLAHVGRSRLLVILDDLHWADQGSLELLDYLIRHPVRARVLLVVAHRDRQAPAALTAALTRGLETGAVAGMDLGPLPADDCVQGLAGHLPRARAAELYAASEGNPLYFLSLLHAGAKTGVPARDAAYGLAGLPADLRALLLDELAPLRPAERRILETAAVLGDHATPGLLRTASGFDGGEYDEAVDRLVRRDLLRPHSRGRWTLRHPVIRRLIYESTDPRRRTEAHRRAAAELARSGAPIVEQAHHVEQALTGWDPDAAAVLTHAAERAFRSAPASSAHWLRTVLAVLPDDPEFAARRRDLKIRCARALGLAGGLQESRDLLHEMIEELAPDDPTRIEAVSWCAQMERHLGHHPEAVALLQRELARHGEKPPPETFPLSRELGACRLISGRYPAARTRVARAIAVAREGGGELDVASVLALAALGEAYEGETQAAREFADSAAALTDALTDSDLAPLCETLSWLSWAEVFLERHGDAERHAERGIRIAERGGQLYVVPYLKVCMAHVHLNTCRVPTALALAEEAEAAARRLGSDELVVFSLAFKALIVMYARPPGDATCLEIADEATALSGTSGENRLASAVSLVHGWVALHSGDPQRARQTLLHAGGEDLHRLPPSTRPLALEALATSAVATGDLDAAAHWADRAWAEAEHLDLAGRRAAALRALAQVAAKRGDVAEGARLSAAAARQSARSGTSLREAQSLLFGAALMEAAGQQSRAATMWRRGRRLATAGGALLLTGLARTRRPASVTDEDGEPADRKAALTKREREIVTLVSDGLSNKAIATRLCLSPRTVESHIFRIYRKLGVSSRVALTNLVMFSRTT
jgi:ATP/maltotriose-dependent transcriptional regulator MalT